MVGVEKEFGTAAARSAAAVSGLCRCWILWRDAVISSVEELLPGQSPADPQSKVGGMRVGGRIFGISSMGPPSSRR